MRRYETMRIHPEMEERRSAILTNLENRRSEILTELEERRSEIWFQEFDDPAMLLKPWFERLQEISEATEYIRAHKFKSWFEPLLKINGLYEVTWAHRLSYLHKSKSWIKSLPKINGAPEAIRAHEKPNPCVKWFDLPVNGCCG